MNLEDEVQLLKQQLDWFKRQLFGRKSEKRLIENPEQFDLGRLLGEAPVEAAPVSTEEIHYTRRKGKARDASCVTETGLRFDERVPVEVIELPAPQLQGPYADQYEVIDTRISRRLAQRPGSYDEISFTWSTSRGSQHVIDQLGEFEGKLLSDPDVPIDTNHLARALRVIPMGRKNWLFNWTEIGARHVGIIQGLLSTCRLHEVDPYTYLVDVLQRASLLPAREVEQLTPRCWKTHFADAPLRSDLYHAD